jgi:CheY-like chemotaxis protein
MIEKSALPIIIADDDQEDIDFIKEAFEENCIRNPLVTAYNGEELLNKLQVFKEIPGPAFILLDLNMPIMNGQEAINAIKSDPELRHIPIVVLTTSKSEEDIFKSYNLGVSAYISKPVTMDGLTQIVKQLKEFWLEIVKLPIKVS